MTSRLSKMLALLALVATTGQAEVEFAGYLRGPEGERFVLAEAGRVSDWLGVGASFRGHTVTAYDAQTETLTLTREGATLRLRLKGARTAEEIEQAAAADLRRRRSAELEATAKKTAVLYLTAEQELFALQKRRSEDASAGTSAEAGDAGALDKAIEEVRLRSQRLDLLMHEQMNVARRVADGYEEKHPSLAERHQQIAELKKLLGLGEQ